VTERRIYLDSDRRSPSARKITVRATRWYAVVEVDRDGYVDAMTGREAVLPPAYTEAIDRVREASIDRIWCDGYEGGFSWGKGPRWITLYVQFPHVEVTVEALRSAELDQDYRQLHTLADRLALPVHGWLAPGERELVRGIDFVSPPGAFLRFLRGKAKKHGVRLNGRATPGSVWVRPTLSPAEKQRREMYPDQHPAWMDRWTGYVDPDDAPIRPWVGSRAQNLSRGAVHAQFRPVKTAHGNDCPCGLNLRDGWDNGKGHAAHHAAWALGVRVPKNLEWGNTLAVVTTQSPIAWRKLTMNRSGFDRDSHS